MTEQMQIDARPFPSRRWFLLTLSVFVPLVLLSAILFSAGSVEAEPLPSIEAESLAPASTVFGTVVHPDGSPLTDSTTVCLCHFSPDPDEGIDWDACINSETNGDFTFTDTGTQTIPTGDLFVQAEPPWYAPYFSSLPKYFSLVDASDIVPLGNLTLTHASFAGMVYEPDGTTLADGGWVSVIEVTEDDWIEVAGGDYETGTYAVGGVPSGTFVLVAYQPDDSPFWHSEPVPVTVTEGSQYLVNGTQPISLELTTPQLTVWVEDTSFNPITANVHLWNESGEIDWWMWADPGYPAPFGDLPVGEVFMIEAWPDWTDVPTQANSIVMTVTIEAFPISRTLFLQEPNVVGTIETPEGDPLPQAYEGDDPIPHPAWIHVHSESEGFDVEMMTNPAGQFGLALLPGDYRLSAHPYGNLAFTYTKSLPERFSLGGTVILPEVDLGYIPLTYPSFMGTVFDPEGNPIPGCVSVWLATMDWETVADYWFCGDGMVSDGLKRTQEAGLPYLLGGVPSGDYWLGVDGLPESGLLPAEPIMVHVPPGSQYAPDATVVYDLFLEPAAGPLSVFVVDPSSTPITANVVLMDEWGYEEWLPSHPGQPAQFWGLEPGEYLVRAWPTWLDIPDLANSEPVWVFVEDPLTITLDLLYPNVVGVVTTPEGGSLPPAYDESWDLVHPAEVNVHNEDWSLDIWAATNGDGDFSLALPDDHYSLNAHPFANLALTYTKSFPRDFVLPDPGGGLVDMGPISLTYPCIQGWVEDPDMNRVSAWVDLWRVDGDYWEGDETLWDPPELERPFLFGGLSPGQYAVRSGPPYDDPEEYGSSNIHDFLVPDDCGQQVTLVLEVANFIGHLRLPPDDPWCPDCPVPWAEVKLRTVSGNFEDWTSTDENGRFAFSGLSSGVYVVRAFVPGELEFEYDPPNLEYFTLVSSDEVVTRTMYLQPAPLNKHVIGVVVYDDDGSPVGDTDGDGVGDAWVYAYHEDIGYGTGAPSMPDGSYGLDLRGGLWWVGVEPMHPDVDWYFDPDWEQPVEFPYDPTLTLTEWITLTVARAEFFHVTGVVTTPSGAPIVPGTVKVKLCDDEGHCFKNWVEPNGDFMLWVLPGHYRFWVDVDPNTNLLPPVDNGFDVFVYEDLDLGMFWLRAVGDRTASVSGRVIVSSTGEGLSGVEIVAWTDTGDWNRTETVEDGHYVLDSFPGHWSGGPKLSEEQKEQYVVSPPRIRERHLEAGETISNVNFYLLRRNATIQGDVVDISSTLPITDIEAVVFAEFCPSDVTLPCYIVAEDEVQDGAFKLKVVGNHTYTLGILVQSDGYMAGPPVEAFAGRNQTAYADVAVIEAGTRIYGHLLDPYGTQVYLPASVYGNEPTEGYWVEDYLWPEKDPYEYELWVPTPATEPMTWTLWLGVNPHTGYVPDPAHPEYTVVVPPGETNILQIMYVRELDTQITGTVVMLDGSALAPVSHVWVFAKGREGTDSEGLYFEVKTDEQGKFAMYVLPGDYEVNAYLPPHLADDFYPPLPKEWDSMDDNPVIIKFRPRPTGTEALSISGSLTVSPTGALDADTPILVLGWSRDAGYSEVTGTLGSGYHLPVISDTTWHVWAVYEDHGGDALYFSEEKRVTVGSTDVSGVNLMLELADFPLPDAVCESFDPLVFKRISLPTRPSVPEPLIEIQAGTMPVSGTVEVCATPILGVPGGHLLVGFAYEIEARDSQGNLITDDFNKSVRLIFYYNADLLGDFAPEDLAPAFFSTARQEWVELDDVYIDPDDWFVTGKTDHFSRIGIRGAEAGENMIYLPLVLRDFDG